VINKVFIIPKLYHFEKVKEFKSYFLVMTLTRDKKIFTSLIMNKYLLHIINEMKIW